MDDATRAIYQQLLSAHQATYGEPASVKMRHYLQGQADALVRDLGVVSEKRSQAEDGRIMNAPVEETWEHERRGGRVERRWREVQFLRTRALPLGEYR